MIDVIERALAAPQIDQILDRCNKIFVRQDALGSIHINSELLINFVTADPAKIIFLGIKEESFEQRAGVGHRWRITGAKPAINILESFFLVMRRVFPKRLHDRIIVRDIDDFNLMNVEGHDLANCSYR